MKKTLDSDVFLGPCNHYIENVNMNSSLHGQYQKAAVQYNLSRMRISNNVKNNDSHTDLDA